MSAITELDEKEIASYTNLNAPGGIGPKLQFAMDSYTGRLGRVAGEGFYEDDTSNAHAVMNELVTQMRIISNTMDDVDSLIDNLIYVIKTGIIDKENETAETVTEG